MRSFGCPNGSRDGREVWARGVFLAVGPSSDPPDPRAAGKFLGHVTCRTWKITEPSKLGFDHLAQETLGSERSDACVARSSASPVLLKKFFGRLSGRLLEGPIRERPWGEPPPRGTDGLQRRSAFLGTFRHLASQSGAVYRLPRQLERRGCDAVAATVDVHRQARRFVSRGRGAAYAPPPTDLR